MAVWYALILVGFMGAIGLYFDSGKKPEPKVMEVIPRVEFDNRMGAMMSRIDRIVADTQVIKAAANKEPILNAIEQLAHKSAALEQEIHVLKQLAKVPRLPEVLKVELVGLPDPLRVENHLVTDKPTRHLVGLRKPVSASERKKMLQGLNKQLKQFEAPPQGETSK